MQSFLLRAFDIQMDFGYPVDQVGAVLVRHYLFLDIVRQYLIWGITSNLVTANLLFQWPELIFLFYQAVKNLPFVLFQFENWAVVDEPQVPLLQMPMPLL